MVFHGDLHVGV